MIMAMSRVIFEPTKWEIEETETDLYFHVTGLNQQNETVHARIEGFHPFAFLQLPARVTWSESNQKRVIRWITKRMGGEAPTEWRYERKFLIRGKRRAQCIRLSYPTSKHLRTLGYRIYNKQGLHIDGLGHFSMGEFRLHEHTIDMIVKYTAVKRLKLNGWLEVTPRKNLSDEAAERMSTCVHDVHVYHKHVKTVEGIKTQIDPVIFSFDIETYSHNKNAKIPDATHPKNVVFQIAVQCGRMSSSVDEYRSVLLSLNSCPPIDSTEVRNYLTERELIEGFSELVLEMDPDVFIGYNILKFDWEYLLKRAERCGCYHTLLKCGRIMEKRSNVETVRWSSGAYGQQNFDYLNVDGRVNMDVFPEVERNYKLDTYSLDAVSEEFLGEKKEDMDYRQMFTMYEISTGLDAILQSTEQVNQTQHKQIIDMVQSCMTVDDLEEIDHRKNHILELHRRLESSTPDDVVQTIRDVWRRVGVYCLKDTILPVRLFHTLHLWEGLKQLANVTCIPTWYLQTRGQQIKVLSQLHRKALFDNVVIEYRKHETNDDDERYQGATVIDPVTGFYEDGIVTNDFASLYPSIIQAYNISPDTFVDDPSVSDSLCHIIEWEDHRGCEHDTKQRKTKVKKEDVLCGSHRYRFLKEKRDKDGNIVSGEGIMPNMLRTILAERKSVKKEMKQLKKRPDYKQSREKQTEYVVLDSIQKGLKISANSVYGLLGAKKGMCPLPEGAASVTAKGRMLIHETARLTTEQYPFARVIYGDTDSIMIDFRGKSLKERFRLGVESAAYVTSKFPAPIELEFECIYMPYLLLGKKAYATCMVDEEGNVLKSDEKGLLSVRRDNFHALRELYVEIMDLVRAGSDRDEVVYRLISRLNRIFHQNLNHKKFVLYKGINDVDEYDEDSRDAHVMLARKMGMRGNKVAPNTRMQFVFLKSDSPLQGDKVEDWEYYVQNRRKLNLELDYLYYLEKFVNPFTKLFEIRYPGEEVLYEKPDDSLTRQLHLLDERQLAKTTFCLDRFSHIRRMPDKIAYIRQHLDRQTFPELLHACDRWHAANVMERVYAKYGVPKRVAKRPKKGEVTLRKDCKMLKEFHQNHATYHQVVEHLNSLFSTDIIFK